MTMALLCKFGLHAWRGCICTRCNRVRDEQHDWRGCKCTRCSRVRDEQHEWNGCTCAHCNRKRHTYVANVCKTCGRLDSSVVNDESFRKAADTGNVALVKLLLAERVSLNAYGHDGYTALNYAAKNGHTEVVRLLLSSGASTEEAIGGYTPLRHAVLNNRVECVRLLIEAGANAYASVPDSSFVTMLDCAKTPEMTSLVTVAQQNQKRRA